MNQRPHIPFVISEENTSELELLAYFLRGAGFRVTCITHDVASSQRVLQRRTIDIAIAEDVLADGLDTSAANATWLSVPAITRTGSPPLRHGRRRDAYIRKPVSIPGLRDANRTALSPMGRDYRRLPASRKATKQRYHSARLDSRSLHAARQRRLMAYGAALLRPTDRVS
jgi:hypothetical protein